MPLVESHSYKQCEELTLMFVIEPIATIAYPHPPGNFFPRNGFGIIQCDYNCSGFDVGEGLFVLWGCGKEGFAGLICALLRATAKAEGML